MTSVGPGKAKLSLRTKGVLALTLLVLYFASVALFTAHERRNLFLIVQEMEAIQSNEELLRRVSDTVAHSLIDTQALIDFPASDARQTAASELAAKSMQPVRVGLQGPRRVYALLDRDAVAFERAVAAMDVAASDRHLAEVRDREQGLIVRLNEIMSSLQARYAELGQRYHDSQQYITFIADAANIVGIIAAVATILIFFSRLTRDIARLQDRAVAIVAGYSGEPLRNTRHDEIGGLIDAVNRMQVDLRRSEQQQEITRQQRFHQEKMAAVGSLATAIGHEVSNPIAAISGMAQVMVDETRDEQGAKSPMLHEFAAEIVKQTQRITVILRQLATLTTPHSPKPALLDLNALIRSTCGFISYDARFRRIEFEFDLAPGIPAVNAVADHLTQIIMNLLINAADAMDGSSEKRRIRISTRQLAGEIEVAIRDNGHGMSAEVLAKAFQESFTTKPAGKGRGIGLFLCKTLIEEAGGRIALESTPNAGTTASLYLRT
jgi:two-component system, NtrC family, sensor kinase